MLLTQKDARQGKDMNEREYGFCGIDDRGGQFFTWCDTLSATLASVEDCEIDPPVNWPARAYQEVRGFIRRSWKRRD